MAEHLNVVIILERVVSAAERVSIVFELSSLYASELGNLQEVCRNDYNTGASHCKLWPAGKTLLETAPCRDELLFIYGDKSFAGSGARSSLHIAENGQRTSFTASFPLSVELDCGLLTRRLLATAELAGRIAGTSIVLAGWELEGDIDQTAEDVLLHIADDALCLWIAGPKQQITTVPHHFAMADESNYAVLLARKS